MKVAVVGAGVSGIAAAYGLRHRADVTVFESQSQPGGHARTVEVDDAGRTLGLDTAFIVFNEPHYPGLSRFFRELGVGYHEHIGRFSFHDIDAGTCYVSEDFDLDEEETRRRYPEDFTRLWSDAHRFLRESPGHFIRKQAEMPLGDYLDAHGYGDSFRHGFIVMLTTAAWSVPAELVWEMPAATVIAFFLGHGYEGLGGRTVPWHTVDGGSISYVRAAIAALRAAGQSVRCDAVVTGVRERADGVEIVSDAGVEIFDRAVVATHADDAVRLLDELRGPQHLLTEIGYNATQATLHTDTACQPAPREKWRSWNYVRGGTDDRPTTWVNYYLNRLQDFESTTDYFLTLDSGVPIDPSLVIQDFRYRHPILTQRVRDLQAELPAINRTGSRLVFAGSYFHSRKMGIDVMGNHEAAFDSGCAAAEAVLSTAPVPASG